MRRSWRIAAIGLFILALALGGLLGDRLLAVTDETRDSLRLYTELALEENPVPPTLRTRRLEDPTETKYHEPVIVAGPPGEAPELTEPRSAGFPSSPEPDAVPPGHSAPPDLPEPR